MSRRGPRSPRFDASDPLLDAPVGVGRGRSCGSITGKGRNSADGPVLLPRVRTLLSGALARYVADWRLGDDGDSFVVKVR